MCWNFYHIGQTSRARRLPHAPTHERIKARQVGRIETAYFYSWVVYANVPTGVSWIGSFEVSPQLRPKRCTQKSVAAMNPPRTNPSSSPYSGETHDQIQ